MTEEKKRRHIELGEKFMKMVQRVPAFPPCLTCGRIVMIGRCCSDPKFGPWPPCANCGTVFGTTKGDCCADPYFPDDSEKSDDTK
jgi:hypothetical protein